MTVQDESGTKAQASRYVIADGNEEIREHIPRIIDIVSTSARWVHPDTFSALPVWCPWAARGRQLFDKSWTRKYTNTSGRTGATVDKVEGNGTAKDALVRALGVASPEPKNWTVCHIWGYDDDAFATQGSVVRDPRYFTCVGNMLWLPTPLKGFTDALPEVKAILRACAFNLYGWACEHDDVNAQASSIRAGLVPDGYPSAWPTSRRTCLPPGTAPFSDRVRGAVADQKARIKALLADQSLTYFPRDDVRRVLDFWRVEL